MFSLDLHTQLNDLEQRTRDLFEPADGEEESYLVMRLREELRTGIEELRVADEQLRESRDAARRELDESAADESTQAVLQLAGLPYFETDTNGLIRRVNREFGEFMVRQSRFLIGKPVVTLLVESCRPHLRESLTALSRGDDFAAVNLVFELRDGTQKSCIATAARTEFGDQTVLRWILRDGTEDEARSQVVGALTAQLDSLSSAATLSRSLLNDESPIQSILERLVVLAEEAVDADGVTVELMNREAVTQDAGVGHESLTSFTTEQMKAKNGPSWDAAQDSVIIRTDSVQTDPRWVPIHDVAAAHQVQAVQAIPLLAKGRVLGVLTAYRSSAKPFTDEDEASLQLLVDHATPVIANKRAYDDLAREAENLAVAIASRGVIEQAKGMIMCVEKCTEEEAFNRLKELSQHSNVKLRELAAGVVERMSRPKP